MKAFAIQTIIRLLLTFMVDYKVFDKARELVQVVMKSDLTSEQKRAFVVEQLRKTFSDATGYAINLATELAVAYIKANQV